MSSTKIEHLTPEQEAMLHKHVEEWIVIGLASGEANQDVVEPIITDFYEAAGLEKPTFIYAPSPFAAQTIPNSANPTIWSSVESSIWDTVGDSVRSRIEDCVEGSIGNHILAGVWTRVRTGIEDRVEASVADRILAGIWSTIAVDEVVFYSTCFLGSHDAHWIAYYLFYQQCVEPDIYEPEDLHRLNQWGQLAQNCGWWYPFKDRCVVCNRPIATHVDDRGRLHNLDGMAVEYSDGWGVYAINGVRVPADVVTHPESITVERILNETNTEVSRAMVEIYGEDRLMQRATLIDDSGDPETGSLWRFEFKNDEPIVKLKLQNSTQDSDGSYKTYWVRVPPHFESAEEARAWTFYGDTDSFNPSVET